ncbi:transport protein TonB [Lacunisphaera limnophila]|uniref:Transport protein TonB n=1 Tax=Lacunisphaera limnophila TaxID=1838286 RepID=A0A1D8AS04_9BACT|nr:TonB family protein [Lacunisphaera limnophila]AOS43668.1 transport protein TonB [Lacunisphaera limnophila]
MSPRPPRPALLPATPTPARRRAVLLPGLALLLLLSTAARAQPVADAAPAARAKATAPVAVRTVSPEHPPELLKTLTNGDAVLECLVDVDGEVRDIKVVSETHPGFAAAAEEALLQWEFKPATLDGHPKAQRIVIPFEFRLSRDQMLASVAGRPVFMEVTETIIPAQQLPQWPRPVDFFVPRYPASLAGTGKYGKAVVNVTIDKEGKVINPRLVKATYPEFGMPAMATATQLRFAPQVMADGRKIYVSMDIQFDFEAPKEKSAKEADPAEGKAKKKK